MSDTKAPILFKCPTCPTSVPQSELLRHIATCEDAPVEAREVSMGEVWGSTLRMTLDRVKRVMTTRKFRWVSRLIMFPVVFMTCAPSVVGLALLSFVAWRVVRTAQVLGRRVTARRAEKAAQPPKTKNVRRIRFEIKIG